MKINVLYFPFFCLPSQDIFWHKIYFLYRRVFFCSPQVHTVRNMSKTSIWLYFQMWFLYWTRQQILKISFFSSSFHWWNSVATLSRLPGLALHLPLHTQTPSLHISEFNAERRGISAVYLVLYFTENLCKIEDEWNALHKISLRHFKRLIVYFLSILCIPLFVFLIFVLFFVLLFYICMNGWYPCTYTDA